MRSTFEIPLDTSLLEDVLTKAQAKELSKQERKVFVGLYVRGISAGVLKKQYCDPLNPDQIPGRLFNALLFSVQGKVKAWQECEKLVILNLKEKIKKVMAQRNGLIDRVNKAHAQKKVRTTWLKGTTKTKNSLKSTRE